MFEDLRDAFIIVENICCQGSSLGCDFYFRSKERILAFADANQEAIDSSAAA